MVPGVQPSAVCICRIGREELAECLGTTVEIKPAHKGRGKLIVHYASLDHLEQLLKKLR